MGRKQGIKEAIDILKDSLGEYISYSDEFDAIWDQAIKYNIKKLKELLE